MRNLYSLSLSHTDRDGQGGGVDTPRGSHLTRRPFNSCPVICKKKRVSGVSSSGHFTRTPVGSRVNYTSRSGCLQTGRMQKKQEKPTSGTRSCRSRADWPPRPATRLVRIGHSKNRGNCRRPIDKMSTQRWLQEESEGRRPGMIPARRRSRRRRRVSSTITFLLRSYTVHYCLKELGWGGEK